MMNLSEKLTLALTVIGTGGAIIVAILTNFTTIRNAFTESGLSPILKRFFVFLRHIFVKYTSIVFIIITISIALYIGGFFYKKTSNFMYKKSNFNIEQIEQSALFWELIKENVDWNKGKGFLGTANFWLHNKPDGTLSITYSHGGVIFYPNKGDTKNFLPVGPVNIVLKDADECNRLKDFFYNPSRENNKGRCFQNQTSDDYRCSIITDFIAKVNPDFLDGNYKTTFVCGFSLAHNFSYATIIVQENNQSKDLARKWLEAYGRVFNVEYNLSIE